MPIEVIVLVVVMLIITLGFCLGASGFKVENYDAVILCAIVFFAIWAFAADAEREIEEVGIYSVNTVVEDNRAHSFIVVTNPNYVNRPRIFPVDIVTEKVRVSTYSIKSNGILFRFSPIIEPYIAE